MKKDLMDDLALGLLVLVVVVFAAMLWRSAHGFRPPETVFPYVVENIDSPGFSGQRAIYITTTNRPIIKRIGRRWWVAFYPGG